MQLDLCREEACGWLSLQADAGWEAVEAKMQLDFPDVHAACALLLASRFWQKDWQACTNRLLARVWFRPAHNF